MKKFIYALAIAASLLFPVLVVTSTASAVDVFQPCSGSAKSTVVCGDVGAQTKAKTNPVIVVLKELLNMLSLIAGIAATVVLVVSGFRLITSNGDANGVKSARDGVLYVVIGIVVVIIAQSIIAFVINKI